jgi:hypothetical protein
MKQKVVNHGGCALRTRRLLSFVMASSLLAPVAAAGDAPEGFTREQLAQGSPSAPYELYHDVEHSLLAAEKMPELMARMRRPDGSVYSRGEVQLLADIAALHDFDPGRRAGSPPDVGRTVAALRADFSGVKPLFTGAASSVLRTRGWKQREFTIALAIIQRSDFPFHLKRDAQRSYKELVSSLAPADQRMVLELAPVFSEFVDQLSTYTGTFAHAARKVVGLSRELNGIELDTASFLEQIGTEERLEPDRRIAEELGVAVTLPGRAHMLKHVLPPRWVSALRGNIAAFRRVAAMRKQAGTAPGEALSADQLRAGQKEYRREYNKVAGVLAFARTVAVKRGGTSDLRPRVLLMRRRAPVRSSTGNPVPKRSGGSRPGKAHR